MNYASVLRESLKDYERKSSGMSDEEWMKNFLASRLPDMPEEEREQSAVELVEGVHRYQYSLSSLNKAEERGMSKEGWLKRELQNSAVHLNVNQYGQYLSGIDTAIREANEDLARTVLNQDGTVNQNPHLDGFIFESEHAASYNMDAALKNDGSRAEVLRPESGETYAKNSADIQITDADGKVVQEVQAKCYDSEEGSNKAFEQGDYGDQKRLVPEGQADGKSSDHLEQDGVQSKPISKEQVKKEQEEAQKDGIPPKKSWNDYENAELALNLGKQAGGAALLGAAVGGMWEVAGQVIEGEDVDAEKVAEKALKAGARSGLTCAVTGAAKVYLEKTTSDAAKEMAKEGVQRVVSGGAGQAAKEFLRSNNNALSMVVSMGMETASIGMKVADGELTVREGALEVEKSGYAAAGGMIAAAKGAAVGAEIGAVLGPVGAAVGGFIGGTLGSVAGSTFGRKVAEGVQKVRGAVVEGAKKVWEGAKSVGRKIGSAVSSFCSWVGSLF